GTAEGKFYGPKAQNLAGAFNDKSQNLQGVFGANKQ
ncbi:MAG: transferrin-binding protein-like solute binding protein, partial [Neisseriaceae bacterium]|nr:transferrin-binding protein-like solute binding protein [Neisseriaceae bacterium]MBR3481943.1 transferrin-binding protein-like solute binding protein [Neisseriaceae bacterium]